MSETLTLWECFSDPCYYDMWAVRPKGEKRWGHCFHVASGEEARGLVELLNSLSLLGRSGTRDVQQETGSVGTSGDIIQLRAELSQARQAEMIARQQLDIARAERDALAADNMERMEAIIEAEKELRRLFSVLPLMGQLPSPSVMQQLSYIIHKQPALSAAREGGK